MSRANSAAKIPEVDQKQTPPEAPTPFFEMEIPASIYKGREYFAAGNAIKERDGILKNLRAALMSGDGRSVVIQISHR